MEPFTLRQRAGLAPLTSIVPEKTALVLIDLQMDYFTPGRVLIPEGEAAVTKAGALRAWARDTCLTVIHIQHLSPTTSPIFASGTSGVDFHPAVAPADGEIVITKAFPSSFHQTELQATLQARGIDTLIIAGMMTHMCVDTTTRGAAHLGYRAIVAADACATRDLPAFDGQGVIAHQDLHRTVLTALSDRFADVMTLEQVMHLAITVHAS